MYLSRVLADSVSPDGVRLTTLEVEYPHAVHKDIMTHRMLSRNFQSFRAYPPEKVIENILKDPFMPVFTKRVTGMANGVPLEGRELEYAQDVWREHLGNAITASKKLMLAEAGKDQVNFLLQDLTWIRGIITATDWDNFFALRAFAPDGSKPRPEVEKIAQMMYDSIDYSTPKTLECGEWHLPMLNNMEHEHVENSQSWDLWKKVSTGRCARVSYLTHNGVDDPLTDAKLCDRLMGNFHMSPFEHVASPLSGQDDLTDARHVLPLGNLALDQVYMGNFRGWFQYRKEIDSESNMMETFEGPVHPYWRDAA